METFILRITKKFSTSTYIVHIKLDTLVFERKVLGNSIISHIRTRKSIFYIMVVPFHESISVFLAVVAIIVSLSHYPNYII